MFGIWTGSGKSLGLVVCPGSDFVDVIGIFMGQLVDNFHVLGPNPKTGELDVALRFEGV